MNLLSVALSLFLICNPIGNSPAFLAIVKNFDYKRQRFILIREGLFALLIALFFQLIGEVFLALLGIQSYSLSLCGGILLFIVGFNMIFPEMEDDNESTSALKEPFLVPIATPLLAGPSLLTFIMLYSKQANDPLMIFSALCLAWIPVLAVMASLPLVLWLIGKRGLIVLEQIMGMILTMLAVEMIVQGSLQFLKAVS